MPRENEKAYMIDFGLGGHGVSLGEIRPDGGLHHKAHISGYDSPESFERALAKGDKDHYPPLALVPVLDKRQVLKARPYYSYQSPLVSPSLPDGAIDRICAESARSMLPGLSGGFETMAALAIAHDGKPEPGPLDTVSVGDYVRWWTS